MVIRRLVLTLLVASCVICDFKWGGCPKIEYELEQFDVNSYMGIWFEIARSTSTPFEKGNCGKSRYWMNGIDYFMVKNSEVRFMGQIVSEVVKAEKTDNPFRFKLSSTESYIKQFFKRDYQVLNTDYTSFSVVYSCTDFMFYRIEYAWILSRTPDLPQEKYLDLASYLNSKVQIKENSLLRISHDDYYCDF